jgi:hypothetical protein
MVVIDPARAPHVLTIRATPAQMAELKALLATHEGAVSATCETAPSATR